MKKYILLSLLFVCSLLGYTQNDNGRSVVGVAKFTSEVESPFCASVEEKVVTMVTQTKRFIVVDRTSYDKIQEELEFQKTEAFIDSKNTVNQGEAIAAEYLILGHIIKMNIYTMKNNGVTTGYKASCAFTLKVNNVETGNTTAAESFQTEVSPLAASKEQAVNQALQSVEQALYDYFIRMFPINTKILKVLEIKKNGAALVLINGGKSSGIKEGNEFSVEYIEMLEGNPYPQEIGSLKVSKLSGNDFAECVVKKGGSEILTRFNATQNINCKMIIK